MRRWEVLSEEWRCALALPRLLARSPALSRLPRGDGQPVVLLPGWRAPEQTMAPLAAYLRWLGHAARSWGRGVNRGRTEADVEAITVEALRLAAQAGRPIALIGWSLGGVVAREVARAVPQAVAQVLTYGTPVRGGPSFTVAAGRFGAEACARLAARTAARDETQPISVPITAIFTRRDRIVSWPACLDQRSPRVTHVEVASTHLSMGFDPDVWEVVARRLGAQASNAEPEAR